MIVVDPTGYVDTFAYASSCITLIAKKDAHAVPYVTVCNSNVDISSLGWFRQKIVWSDDLSFIYSHLPIHLCNVGGDDVWKSAKT